MKKLNNEDLHDFTAIYNYLCIKTALPEHADAIIACGSGTHMDQPERAAELFHERRAPLVIVTGFAHPLFGVNEAQIMYDDLIKRGVPEERIHRESRATNSGLNIILSAQKLAELNIKPQKIILVHKPYMTRKLLATAEVQWPFTPKPQLFITSVKDSFREYIERDKRLGLDEFDLGSMLKDFESVRDFVKTGFGTIQDIPAEVLAAYRRLAERGYLTREHDSNLATKNLSS